MGTATVHIERIDGGYAGIARCYRLEPAFRDHQYVTIELTPSVAGGVVGPEAKVFGATETGAVDTRSMVRQPGSFTLHDEPDSADRVEGGYWYALLSLGYEITG